MQGWKELAKKVDKEYSQLSKSGNTLVLCDNYGQAGAINYYSEIRVKAMSFNADYINWIDLSKKYKNVIRVKDASEAGKELKESGSFLKLQNWKILLPIHTLEKEEQLFSVCREQKQISIKEFRMKLSKLKMNGNSF